MDFGVSFRVRHFWPRLAGCLLFSLVIVCAQGQPASGSSAPADQYYEQGLQSLTQEQWKSAVSSFAEVLKLDPRRADAENGMGVALGKLGDQKNSLAAFRRAIEINPGYAEAHYNLALWLQVSGDMDQAVSELTTAIKLRPDYEAAQFALASIFQDAGQTDKALELFRTILKEDPRSAEAHNWLGVAYAQKNQLLDSISEFQQAVDINPEYLEAYNNLASTFARAKRFDDAVRVLRSALLQAPQNSELRLNLSRALRAKGSLDAALSELRPLLKDGDNPEVECEFAEILRQKGDFPEAVDASEKALALRPGMARAYENLGLALQGESGTSAVPHNGSRRHVPAKEAKDRYDAGREFLSQGDMQNAEKEFEKSVQADPNWAEAHNLLGFVIGQLGNLPAAIEHLRKAVALDPALPTAHYNLGVALWYSGQRTESVGQLNTALTLDPAFGEAYSFLGMASGQTGDLNGGRRYLDRAISLNPGLPGPHIDLGIILLQSGQSKAAFEQFQLVASKEEKGHASQVPDLGLAIDAVKQAITQKPDDPLAYDTLGLLLGKAGSDPQLVMEQFRKAIQLNPNFAEAHNHLGMALIQTGDDEAAAKEFREALRLNPNYAEAHGNLGATLIASKDDEALNELERAISLQPDSVKAQYNLAMAYLQKYGVDKEIQQLQKVIAMDPKFAEAYYSLGKALMQKGQVQDAIAPLRQAVSLDPTSGSAHYQLGLALSRTGKTEEGKAELDRGLKLTADDERNRKADELAAQAKLELDKGETQQAADDLGKLVQLMPDYAEGHVTLAQTLAKLGDVEGAIAEFKRALEIDPNLYAAHLGLGQLFERKGDQADAATEFREAVRLQPSSAEAYRELGSTLNQQGDANGAAVAFQKALQIDPADAAARENLDAILKKAAASRTALSNAPGSQSSFRPQFSTRDLAANADGDDLDQIENFETLIEQDKIDEVEPLVVAYLNDHANSWRGHYIQGYVLFRMRKIGDSIRELAKSLELNANNPEAHKILAKDFVVIGKWDYAQTELQQAERLKPESAEIHYSLGEVYSGRDMLKEAKVEFVAAIQNDPANAEAYNALGFTEESLGNDTAALAAYKKAMEIADEKGSKFDAPYINVSEYYNRLNQPEPALEYARKAIALNSKSDLGYYQLARAHQSRGEWDQSADALRHAISLNPTSAQYYYVLSQVYRSLGKQPESLAALKSFQELKHAEELVDEKMRDNR